MVFTVKVAYNIEIVKIAKTYQIFLREYYVRMRLHLVQKETHSYITFTSKYIFLIFTEKVDWCDGCINKKFYLTWTALWKYSFRYFGKLKEISLLNSTVYEAVVPKYSFIWVCNRLLHSSS